MYRTVFLVVSCCLTVVLRGAIAPEAATRDQPAQMLGVIGQWGGQGDAVAIQGHYAYFGQGPRLAIIDVTEPTRPIRVGQSAVLPGIVSEVVMAGSFAFLAAGDFVVCDVADPAAPREIRRLSLGGTASDVFVSAGLAYVTAGFGGLQIFDVHDPAAIRPLATLNLHDMASAVFVAGRFAYVVSPTSDAGLPSVLKVVDVSSPAAPRLVAALQDASLMQGVVVSGGFAYLPALGSGMLVVDVTNPLQPRCVGSLRDPTGLDPISGLDLALTGDSVILAANNYGLLVVNVADPHMPQIVAIAATARSTQRVVVADGRAYAASAALGLQVVELGSPGAGIVNISPPVPYMYAVHGRTDMVVVAGQYGLRTVDVTDPAQPLILGSMSPADLDVEWPTGAFLAGDHAYVSDAGSRLHVVDLSNPTAPVQVAEVIRGPSFDVKVRENLAYVTFADYGLQILDVSNPRLPRELGLAPISDTRRVGLSGNHAFVLDRNSTLHVVDVSEPNVPDTVADLPLSGSAEDMAVSGNFVYVADSDAGLRILDISEPTNPKPVTTFAVARGIHRVFVAEDRAYVLGIGLDVIDVSDPHLPRLVTHAAVDESAMQVFAAGNVAAIAAVEPGLQVVDLSQVDDPQVVGTLDLGGGDTRDVAVADGHAYLASAERGVTVLDISQPETPRAVGALPTPGESAYRLAVRGSLAGIVETWGLRLADVSDPSKPVARGWLATPVARDLQFDGTRAYVASPTGLLVVDLSDADNPRQIGRLDLPNDANSLTVATGRAYVATNFNGLHIVDTSDPSSPRELGVFPDLRQAEAVALRDGFAYVADVSGVTVLDVHDPRSPVRVGGLVLGIATDIAIDGNMAYVVVGGALALVDVTSPAVPRLVDRMSLPSAMAVHVDKGLAYVATRRGGLYIVGQRPSQRMWLPMVRR